VRVAQGPILRSSISAVNFSDTRLSTRVWQMKFHQKNSFQFTNLTLNKE
jgi:hypothetical protein